MKLNKQSKLILIIISLIFCIIAFSGNVKAAKTGFTENIPGPRKYFETSKEKLSDVTLTLVSSIAIEKVEIRENGNIVKPTESVTTNAKNHIYKFSHDSMLKSKTHTYTVKVVDSEKNQYESTFSIFVKKATKNGKEIQYYSVNDSPRLTEQLASENTLYLKNRDLDGTKTLKVQDLNSSASVSFSDLRAGERYIEIDTKKFKSANNYFKLKVTAVDSSDKSQKTEQIITFKLSGEKVDVQINKKNVTTMLDLIESYSKQIQKDYKAGRYWEYSNNQRSNGEKQTYNSFEDAKKGERTTNCARIVFWSFYDMEIISKKEDIYSNASGELKASDRAKKEIQEYAKIIKVNKSPNQLKREKNLKPGDICLYAGHTNIYIGNDRWYDAGRGSGIGNAEVYRTGSNGTPIYRFKTVGPCKSAYMDKTVTYIIRLKDQS